MVVQFMIGILNGFTYRRIFSEKNCYAKQRKNSLGKIYIGGGCHVERSLKISCHYRERPQNQKILGVLKIIKKLHIFVNF